MAKWTNAIVTAKGKALLAKLIEGNTLDLTRVVSGTGIVPVVTLYNQTAVTDEVQALEFLPVAYPEEGKVKVPVLLSNDELIAGYRANQIGAYATDPDEGEILFFIAQADQTYGGMDIPSATEMPGYTCEWNFYFSYGQADGVNVTMDPAGLLSVSAADERYAPLSHVSDVVKHITAEERSLWNDAAGMLTDIDCGYFVETELMAHMTDPEAHTFLMVDGNVTEANIEEVTLDEHVVDPNAHPNMIIDGNDS